jgi:hypothetical protein
MVGDVGTDLGLFEIARRQLLGPLQHLPHARPIRKRVLVDAHSTNQKTGGQVRAGEGRKHARETVR